MFRGRRDRMVKRRGYRVELGEIEAAFNRHESVREVAVVASSDSESGVSIELFFDWSADSKPSQIKLRKFSMENLPSYMIPDRFTYYGPLPKTSTNKNDYQSLKKSN